MIGAGVDFPLDDDNRILAIDSPRGMTGPYAVVLKHTKERWAIVALDWEGEPRLGLRWFWASAGNLFSSGHATWMIIPPSLSRSLLGGLLLAHEKAVAVDHFLAVELDGSGLAAAMSRRSRRSKDDLNEEREGID